MRTLLDAINEGFVAIKMPENKDVAPAEIMKAHVIEWLRQKFTLAHYRMSVDAPAGMPTLEQLSRNVGVRDPEGYVRQDIQTAPIVAGDE